LSKEEFEAINPSAATKKGSAHAPKAASGP
jgi:hypothetical protein